MPNTDKPTKAPAALKLTPMQAEILLLIEKNGYGPDEVKTLLGYAGKTELEDFISDLDILFADYLCSVESIAGCELTALCKLNSFIGSLRHIARQV